MLKTRILTAIILIPIILLAIFKLPPIYLSTLMGACILIGAWEWSSFVSLTTLPKRISYVCLIAAGLFFSAFLPELLTLSAAVLFLVWIFIAILQYQKEDHDVGFQYPAIRALLGFVVLIATWVALVTLAVYPHFGSRWLLLVLGIIWGADIGGYFGGRYFGKRALV